MKKRRRLKMSGKALARIISVVVFGLSTAIIALTVWFFAKTLRGVDSVRSGNSSSAAKLQGINGEVLDQMLKFDTDRTDRPYLSDDKIGDPFLPVAKEEVPPAAPTQAPAETAQPTPPPAADAAH